MIKNWDETVSPSYASPSLPLFLSLSHIYDAHTRFFTLALFYSLYETQERDCGKKLFYLPSPTGAFVCKHVYVCPVYLHVSFCIYVYMCKIHGRYLMSDYKEIRQLVNLSNR